MGALGHWCHEFGLFGNILIFKTRPSARSFWMFFRIVYVGQHIYSISLTRSWTPALRFWNASLNFNSLRIQSPFPKLKITDACLSFIMERHGTFSATTGSEYPVTKPGRYAYYTGISFLPLNPVFHKLGTAGAKLWIDTGSQVLKGHSSRSAISTHI